MIDRQQAAAYLHGTHHVLGRDLAPFGAKHLLALAAHGSPWIGQSDLQRDLGTALAAVEILHCRTGRQLQRVAADVQLDEAHFAAQVEAFHALDDEAQQLEFDKLQDYLESYWEVPRLINTGVPGNSTGKAPKSTCHAAIGIAQQAMTELGLSRREAWWAPICELQWELHSAAERKAGKPIPIWSDESIADYLRRGFSWEAIVEKMNS